MFNPKAKKLDELLLKDLSKKSIQKLGKKAVSQETALPFFIKSDFEYTDGTIAPLFLFGKIKHLKNETKLLKGNTEQHGFAFVKYDAKGVSTLCLIPTKGKLAGKDAILKKAMREAFTNAWADYELLKAPSEAEIEAMEAKAEAAAEIVGEVEDADVAEPVAEPIPTQPPKNEANANSKLIPQIAEKLTQIGDFLAGLVKSTNGQIIKLDTLYAQIDEKSKVLKKIVQSMDDLGLAADTSLQKNIQSIEKQITDLYKTADSIVNFAELDPEIPEAWQDDIENELKAQNANKNKLEKAIATNPAHPNLLDGVTKLQTNFRQIAAKAQKVVTNPKHLEQMLAHIKAELQKVMLLEQHLKERQAKAANSAPGSVNSSAKPTDEPPTSTQAPPTAADVKAEAKALMDWIADYFAKYPLEEETFRA